MYHDSGIKINKYGAYISQLPYLILAFEFLYALVLPENNVNFVNKLAILIFITELIGWGADMLIYSIILVIGNIKGQVGSRFSQYVSLLGLVLFLPFIAIAVYQISGGSVVVIISFVLSLLTKLYWVGKDLENSKLPVDMIYQIPILFTVLIPLVIFAQPANGYIQFPEQFLPTQSTGAVFNDYPQVMLMWGFTYYLISFIVSCRRVVLIKNNSV